MVSLAAMVGDKKFTAADGVVEVVVGTGRSDERNGNVNMMIGVFPEFSEDMENNGGLYFSSKDLGVFFDNVELFHATKDLKMGTTISLTFDVAQGSLQLFFDKERVGGRHRQRIHQEQEHERRLRRMRLQGTQQPVSDVDGQIDANALWGGGTHNE